MDTKDKSIVDNRITKQRVCVYVCVAILHNKNCKSSVCYCFCVMCLHAMCKPIFLHSLYISVLSNCMPCVIRLLQKNNYTTSMIIMILD